MVDESEKMQKAIWILDSDDDRITQSSSVALQCLEPVVAPTSPAKNPEPPSNAQTIGTEASKSVARWTRKTRFFQRRKWTKSQIKSLDKQGIWKKTFPKGGCKWQNIYHEDAKSGLYSVIGGKGHRKKRNKISKLSRRLVLELLDSERTAKAQNPQQMMLAVKVMEQEYPCLQMCPESGEGANCIAKYLLEKSIEYQRCSASKREREEEVSEEEREEEDDDGEV